MITVPCTNCGHPLIDNIRREGEEGVTFFCRCSRCLSASGEDATVGGAEGRWNQAQLNEIPEISKSIQQKDEEMKARDEEEQELAYEQWNLLSSPKKKPITKEED